MALACAVVLSLLWSVVPCQTFPYVSSMGQALVNHSYVDLSTVGSADDNSDSVVCHSDLYSCCSGSQGHHRGLWYFPGGTRLTFFGDMYERRGAQTVFLRRTTATGPTGIYRCDIPTDAVHDYDNSVRDIVYVGLYTGSGGIIYISIYFLSLIFLFHRRYDNIWRYNSYCAL